MAQLAGGTHLHPLGPPWSTPILDPGLLSSHYHLFNSLHPFYQRCVCVCAGRQRPQHDSERAAKRRTDHCLGARAVGPVSQPWYRDSLYPATLLLCIQPSILGDPPLFACIPLACHARRWAWPSWFDLGSLSDLYRCLLSFAPSLAMFVAQKLEWPASFNSRLPWPWNVHNVAPQWLLSGALCGPRCVHSAVG